MCCIQFIYAPKSWGKCFIVIDILRLFTPLAYTLAMNIEIEPLESLLSLNIQTKPMTVLSRGEGTRVQVSLSIRKRREVVRTKPVSFPTSHVQSSTTKQPSLPGLYAGKIPTVYGPRID